VILEGAVVRAAAVGAMAKYAANCAMLNDSIKVLLKRCCLDVDDEVRDRATFYSQLLSSNNRQLITDYLSEPMHVIFLPTKLYYIFFIVYLFIYFIYFYNI